MSSESTFKERFRRSAAEKGLSVTDLQDKLRVSCAYVYNSSRLSPSIAIRLKRLYPDVNIEWINEGTGDMLTMVNDKIEKEPIARIPLLPIVAVGGLLNDIYTGETCINCEKIINPVAEAKLALTVVGDSMSPEYPNGSIVFVCQIDETSFIEWGSTFVLDTPNGVVIKNIYPSPEEDKIIGRSVNQSYPSFEVSKSNIRGWYKVLLVMMRK